MIAKGNVEFKLSEEMSAQQFLDEVKGRISGEGTVLIHDFLGDPKVDFGLIKKEQYDVEDFIAKFGEQLFSKSKNHRVLMVDKVRGYAVVSKMAQLSYRIDLAIDRPDPDKLINFKDNILTVYEEIPYTIDDFNDRNGGGSLYKIIRNGKIDDSPTDHSRILKLRNSIYWGNSWFDVESFKKSYNDGEKLYVKHQVTFGQFLNLIGISDEGFYFLHPLANFNLTPAMEMNDVLRWVNKADQSFKRVQGDILLKFVPVMKTVSTIYDERYNYSGQQKTQMGTRVRVESEWMPRTNSISFGYCLNNNGVVDPNLGRSSGQTSKVMIIGNSHMLSTDGVIIEGWGSASVDGKVLVLQHSEHETVKMDIPENHVAVIATQSGNPEGDFPHETLNGGKANPGGD